MTEEETMCEQKNLNRRLPPFLIGVMNPIMFIFEDDNSDDGCFSIVRSSVPHPTWRSILNEYYSLLIPSNHIHPSNISGDLDFRIFKFQFHVC